MEAKRFVYSEGGRQFAPDYRKLETCVLFVHLRAGWLAAFSGLFFLTTLSADVSVIFIFFYYDSCVRAALRLGFHTRSRSQFRYLWPPDVFFILRRLLLLSARESQCCCCITQNLISVILKRSVTKFFLAGQRERDKIGNLVARGNEKKSEKNDDKFP